MRGKMWLRLSSVLICMVLLGVACRKQIPTQQEQQFAKYPQRLTHEPVVRILIANHVEQTTLAISGAYSLETVRLDGKRENISAPNGVSVKARPTVNGIKLGAHEYRTVTITPASGTRLSLNGKRYPGSMTFLSESPRVPATAPRRLMIVLALGIEEYLTGVLPHEVSAQWPIEALRAQAVASRTFALYQIRTREEKSWDVKATVDSQVWKPAFRVALRVVFAVNSTRGIVVTDNYRLFPTYFSARCGGFTADAKAAGFYPVDTVPLAGVRCPFCLSRAAPPGWRFAISQADLNAQLKQHGIKLPDIKKLHLLGEQQKRIPAQQLTRVYAVELVAGNGKRQVISGRQFRLALGRQKTRIASTYFKAEYRDGQWTFVGAGHGHGVGMCQLGVHYLANDRKYRYQYEEIIAHYYPGSTRVRMWEK